MNDQSISEVVAEIEPLLVGQSPGKVFQLGPLSLAIDFRLREQGYLFVSVDPALPRIHLIKRRVRDLEKQGAAPGQFALGLRKELAHTTLRSIVKDPNDRVVRFSFTGQNELGKRIDRLLVAQLTGRSANLFLLDTEGLIIHRARATRITGQDVGEIYSQPSRGGERRARPSDDELVERIRDEFTSPSEAADVYFTSLLSEQGFDDKAAAALSGLRKKIAQQRKLLKQLSADLASHANAEQHKRLGDLLLASLNTAKRIGSRVVLTDYCAEDEALIEIEIDEQLTLPEEASRRFALYSRSKRAVSQIETRIAATQTQLKELASRQESLEKMIAERDEAALERFTAAPVPPAVAGGPSAGRKRKPEKKIPGTRRYISSDGFEILVGRAARDNDYLTFKVARPNDLWLHAADYGGSHVVVRNSTRKDVPHRTIIEAAQLAAQFSQARKDPKVDVHYTERKFVSKPKGSAPGLVRLLRSRNITVEPKEGVARILDG